ncbi:DUF1642 domain-containing protein [Enterococcus diestrammenae]|uniref:DUF1642 domain-containing protein n=1 Tax=Enterococcus diestrammenae TaxID=1155073 RepID=UPI003BF6A911
MNKREAILLLEKKRDKAIGDMSFFGEGSRKGLMNEIRVNTYDIAINTLEQIDEPQTEKVEVPDFVAEWLKTNKYSTDIYDLFQAVEYATDSDGFIPENWKWCGEFYDWVSQESDTLYILSDAIRYGYTVKPKRWVVSHEAGKFFEKFTGNGTSRAWVVWKNQAYIFTDRAKAEAVAVLIEGSVEEV